MVHLYNDVYKSRNNWTIKLSLSDNDLQTLVWLRRCADRSALFIMHINVKMPTVVGISTFISTIKNSFIISGLACKWFAQIYMTQVSGQYVPTFCPDSEYKISWMHAFLMRFTFNAGVEVLWWGVLHTEIQVYLLYRSVWRWFCKYI